MKKYLSEGLQFYDIKPLSEERINELLGKVDEDTKSENNKNILIRLLAEKIESRYKSC